MKKKKFLSLPFPGDTIRKRALFILFLFCITAAQANTTYYLDIVNGNDNNDGHSTRKAWKTLGKLNTAGIEPGDKIFLKRGQIFTGTLHLKGQGDFIAADRA